MREPSDATIDRLGDDVARLEAEADAVWAVLDAAGIDVQLGTDTLADGVSKLVRQRDDAVKLMKRYRAGRRSAYGALVEIERALADYMEDVDGSDV